MIGDRLTVAEVAEAERCSMRTILRWIDAGQLRARRQPGGRLRIHRDWYAEMVTAGIPGESVGRILAPVTEEASPASR